MTTSTPADPSRAKRALRSLTGASDQQVLARMDQLVELTSAVNHRVVELEQRVGERLDRLETQLSAMHHRTLVLDELGPRLVALDRLNHEVGRLDELRAVEAEVVEQLRDDLATMSALVLAVERAVLGALPPPGGGNDLR